MLVVPKMTAHLTGHFEIDHQHSLLLALAERLNSFCPQGGDRLPSPCTKCLPQTSRSCVDALASITGELLAFLVGHANYEESLMALLPASPVCQQHIQLHTQAHRDILQRLTQITATGDHDNPKETAGVLYQVIIEWLGSHSAEYDTALTAGLLQAGSGEIAYDGELVHILDEFVFHHRPTKLKFPTSQNRAISREKEGIRTRLLTLTPRQKEVCQLMVQGKTNKTIADELGTTVNTIKTHRTQVFRRMEVTSLLDLVRSLDMVRGGSGRDSLSRYLAHAGSASRAGRSKSFHIVVVEPTWVLRSAVVAGLNALGHRAVGYEDLVALTNLPATEPVDVAVVSVAPTANSLEFSAMANRLKEVWSCNLLVAGRQVDGTGHGHFPDISAADRVLAWPLDFGELSAAVRSIAVGASLGADPEHSET